MLLFIFYLVKEMRKMINRIPQVVIKNPVPDEHVKHTSDKKARKNECQILANTLEQIMLKDANSPDVLYTVLNTIIESIYVGMNAEGRGLNIDDFQGYANRLYDIGIKNNKVITDYFRCVAELSQKYAHTGSIRAVYNDLFGSGKKTISIKQLLTHRLPPINDKHYPLYNFSKFEDIGGNSLLTDDANILFDKLFNHLERNPSFMEDQKYEISENSFAFDLTNEDEDSNTTYLKLKLCHVASTKGDSYVYNGQDYRLNSKEDCDLKNEVLIQVEGNDTLLKILIAVLATENIHPGFLGKGEVPKEMLDYGLKILKVINNYLKRSSSSLDGSTTGQIVKFCNKVVEEQYKLAESLMHAKYFFDPELLSKDMDYKVTWLHNCCIQIVEISELINLNNSGNDDMKEMDKLPAIKNLTNFKKIVDDLYLDANFQLKAASEFIDSLRALDEDLQLY